MRQVVCINKKPWVEDHGIFCMPCPGPKYNEVVTVAHENFHGYSFTEYGPENFYAKQCFVDVLNDSDIEKLVEETKEPITI